jgi:hypothetical protein
MKQSCRVDRDSSLIYRLVSSLPIPQATFNFQTNNFGKGGLGTDRVTIYVQDNGGIDDASFTTPPECALSFSLSQSAYIYMETVNLGPCVRDFT